MWRRRQLDAALLACHDRLSKNAFHLLAAFLDTFDDHGTIECQGTFLTYIYEAVIGDAKAARELGTIAQLMREQKQFKFKPLAEALDELLTRVHEPHAKALADIRCIYIPCQDRV